MLDESIFGKQVSNSSSMLLDPNDLSRHMYILGSSGSGKTTLLRIIFKHLEMANINNTFPNALIYIDTKDDDAVQFLRQCNKTTLENNVEFINFANDEFGLNILELPPNYTNRDNVVSRMIGHIVEMLKEYYSQQQSFVQLERIIRLLLLVLYAQSDKPTLLDLLDLVTKFRKHGKSEVERLLLSGKIEGEHLREALLALTQIRTDGWIPILNRIEQFTTDPYMKKRFVSKTSSLNFEEMLKPGKITIFQISDTETPANAHKIAITSIVMKIWFAIQSRAAKTESDKRSLVVLALDEFQRVKDLNLLSVMLSQSRSYEMSLILSHQNTSQISTELLEIISGNTATQIFGRVSGIDATRVAKIMDPLFSEYLTKQMTVQSDRVFTAKISSTNNSSTPIQFKTVQGPKLFHTRETILDMFKNKKQTTIKSEKSINQSDWMLQLDSVFFDKIEWDVILYLKDNTANQTQIVQAVNCSNRDLMNKVLRDLMSREIITVVRSITRGKALERIFTLMPQCKERLFPKSFKDIGSAQDIDRIARQAMKHYLDLGYFVAIAKQTTRQPDVFRTDLLAYDYSTQTPISVEIESTAETRSHPEHVRFNLTKWRDMGFSKCHVWSSNPKIKEIGDLVNDSDVTVFVV